MKRFFKQLGKELDKKPGAVLSVYLVLFIFIEFYLPNYSLPIIVALALYEICRQIKLNKDR